VVQRIRKKKRTVVVMFWSHLNESSPIPDENGDLDVSLEHANKATKSGKPSLDHCLTDSPVRSVSSALLSRDVRPLELVRDVLRRLPGVLIQKRLAAERALADRWQRVSPAVRLFVPDPPEKWAAWRSLSGRRLRAGRLFVCHQSEIVAIWQLPREKRIGAD
jgi:hypothetical protein